MEARDHDHHVGDNSVEQLVRKPSKHDSASVAADDSERERSRRSLVLGPGKFGKKLFTESLALLFVPLESCADIGGSLGSVSVVSRLPAPNLLT